MLGGTGSGAFGYYTTALMAAAGIALASGAQFSVIGLWRRREPIYLAYAAWSLCIAMLSFSNALLHVASSLEDAVRAFRWMIAAAAASFLPLVIFIPAYTGRPLRRSLLWTTLFLVCLFSWINLASPATLFFETAHLAAPVVLPWGEQLVNITGTSSPWGILFHLLTYTAFLWAISQALQQFRRGDRLRGSLLGFCLLMEFAALLWGDLVIDAMGQRLPYLDSFAFIPFVMLMGLSLATSRVRAEQAQRESEQRYRTLFEAVDEGFCILERATRPGAPTDFVYLAANPAFSRHTGASSVIGKSVREAFPGSASQWQALFEQVVASGLPGRLEEGEPDHQRVLDHYACRLEDGSGQRVAVILRDVTERKRHEQHQRLLLNELNHRVKNTLATVQSIAAQTLRGSSDPEHVRRQFEGRLMALSKVHDVLTRESWGGATLASVVQEALAPYRDPRLERMQFDGPLVWLPPRFALAFAMALHELSTNAIKYGALSNDRGEVTISWSVQQDSKGDQVRLRWSESGGPPVVPPARRGFGSRLIERGLSHEIGGTVRLEFSETGVVCTIEAPLAPWVPSQFA